MVTQADRPHTYRVWMKDGYASLHTADTEAAARQDAIKLTETNIRGAAMTAAERKRALTVDYVDDLDA